MIVTVTTNPAVDRTLTVPGFAIGQINRVQAQQVDPGGKGINVAKAAKQLGCPVIATGFVAGSNGGYISAALEDRGILTDFVNVPGETRVNLKIVDPAAGKETEINEPGFSIEDRHLQELERKIEDLARRCAVMVFSGSLPPGAPEESYARFIRIAGQKGARTILDTRGQALLRGIASGPDLIKPNRAEVEELLETSLQGEGDLVEAAQKFLALGSGSVVISLGAEGALIAFANGLLRARVPFVKTSSSVGAGDTMVAAFAYAMLNELPLDEALQLAAAASSATATLSGTRVADLNLIRQFLPRIALEEVTLPKTRSAP